jgi:hypothetical protein
MNRNTFCARGRVDLSARYGTRWRSGDGEKDGEGASRHDGARLRRDWPSRQPSNRAQQRGGTRGRGGATRNKRREPTVLDLVADGWVPTYFLALSGALEASLVERG